MEKLLAHIKKGNSPAINDSILFYIIRFIGIVLAVLFLTFIHLNSRAATKTSVATGNWSSAATWSPSGVPASTDNVIIHGGNVVTIDGVDTCASLDIGDATSGVTTLKITTAGNSLVVSGNLRVNPNNVNNTYTFDAGPGLINIAGTFNTWGTSGTNTVRVGAGTLTFSPAVTINNAADNITCYGAGTVNFNSAFTDNYNKLVTFTGCNIYFASSYTVNTTFANWGG